MHKLEVNIINNIQDPLKRKYTLTHSDETGIRYLFINNKFTEEKFDVLMDQVVGEWNLVNNKFIFKASCPLSCEASKYSADERYKIFKSHITRALKAIICGDKPYILANDYLTESKIYVFYMYSTENYIVEDLGLVSEYLY
ncbi:staygreen family protein [Clostridium sp. MB40-C1]|uniref:staygreen family protein n=1 Tax=Clostridium sp. MB40-C1 TaxID=3070996 RepID=UPI0027DFD65E|nr:staygreen family protein [Clostridium sp. MB40-C1]WMJ81790.1 staygreen family protein [Clostridium sp. MB40-C1]